jgi:membrane-associated phospholipid phosphatase
MNDLQISKLGIGIITTIVVVKILKNFFKLPRPDINKKGYGFPSTRSAVIAFIITYLIFTNKLSNKTKILLILVFLSACFLKYYMNEHSIEQLIVGAIIGIFIARFLKKNYIDNFI